MAARRRARVGPGAGLRSNAKRRAPSTPGHDPDDDPLVELQQTAGNRAVEGLVSRLHSGGPGEHEATAFEARVAARLPHRPLESGMVSSEAAGAVADLTGPVDGTVVHRDDAVIDALRPGTGADAMAVDGTISLREDVDVAEPNGARVLAHELVHVGQQRRGESNGPAFHNGEHVLSTADLAADEGMVKAFRNQPAIRRGRRGDTVVLLQQRLLAFGYLLPKSTKAGAPDGIFGGETAGAVKMFQRDQGLGDDGVVGHQTVTVLDDLGPRPTPGPDPIAPALGPDEETRKFSVDEYVAAWETKEGRKMTSEERETLSRGCIGITALNMKQGNINPPLDLSFSTFDKARSVADALNAIVAAQPTVAALPAAIDANEELAALKGVRAVLPVDPDPSRFKAIVFSKRFWSNQSDDGADRELPADDAFQPDPDTGQVDMTGYEYRARPGFVNFDYGWYDDETDAWWHANHAEPGMEVYQSTLEYYSRPLRDFDRQTFCVAFARRPS